MSNQPKNEESEVTRSTLYQGAYPPPNPVKGDVWIDPFDTTHEWRGYYWVKIQGPAMVTDPEPYFVGGYNGYRVYYGYPRPKHAETTYWVSDGKAIDDAEIFESITAKADPAGLGSFKKSHWQHVTTPYIIADIKKLLSLSFTEKGPVLPEVNLAQQECTPEEAAEKLDAFEKAAELTGRLDVIKDGQDRLDILRAEVKEKFNQLQAAKGVIAQINQASTYKALTPAALEEFIKTLYHKP